MIWQLRVVLILFNQTLGDVVTDLLIHVCFLGLNTMERTEHSWYELEWLCPQLQMETMLASYCGNISEVMGS